MTKFVYVSDEYRQAWQTVLNVRNSDNDLYYKKIGWKVSQPLIDGMKKTYDWINNQTISNSLKYPSS